MKDNETVVLAAVRQHGYALAYASDTMQNNETVVTAAVQQNGEALWYASANMQNNLQVILAVFVQDWHDVKQSLNLYPIYSWIYQAAVPRRHRSSENQPVPMDSLKAHAQTSDLRFLYTQHPEVLKRLLQAVLKALQVPDKDDRPLKQHLQNIRRPCQEYQRVWAPFVERVLIPANLSPHDEYDAIGRIHADCQTKMHELYLPTPRRARRD